MLFSQHIQAIFLILPPTSCLFFVHSPFSVFFEGKKSKKSKRNKIKTKQECNTKHGFVLRFSQFAQMILLLLKIFLHAPCCLGSPPSIFVSPNLHSPSHYLFIFNTFWRGAAVKPSTNNQNLISNTLADARSPIDLKEQRVCFVQQWSAPNSNLHYVLVYAFTTYSFTLFPRMVS